MNATVNALVQSFGAVHAYEGGNDGLFLIAPNRLGFGAIVSQAQTNDELTAQKLSLLCSLGYPADSLIQFCAYSGPDVRHVLDTYAAERSGTTNPVLRQMVKDRVAFLDEATRRPLSVASNMLLHDTRVCITVSIPLQGGVPTDLELRRARELATAFHQTLASASLGGSPLTARSYIRWMESLLNTNDDAVWRTTAHARHDERRLICEQLLDPGNGIEYDAQGLWLANKTRVRVLTPKFYPPEVEFGMALQYLCDWATGSRGIRENTLITLNVLVPDQEKLHAAIEKKFLWATQQAGTPMARWLPKIRDTKSDFDHIMELKKEGEPLVKAYLSMAVINPGRGDSGAEREETERASIAAAANAKAYWSEQGFKLAEERYNLPIMFSQLLPFAGDSELATFQQRYMTMGARHVAALAPVLGAWRGTSSPMLTLLSRDGQIQAVSNWDSVAPHGLIIASTGSGKSFLAQEMLCSQAAAGVQCFVIDIGYSYKNICEMLDGTFVTFGPETTACLNPFTLVKDFDDEADILLSLVSTMAAPIHGLTEYQRPAVSKIMREVFDQLGNAMTIRDLARALRAHADPRIKDVGDQLYPFSDGENARYFNGQNNVDPNSPFVVLELEELKSRRGLMKVVLMSLIYQIQQVVYNGDRSIRKALLIDEAYALLCEEASDGHNQSIATFLEHSYRRFRKYSASVTIISQDLESVWASNAGRAIVANSHNIYLLAQNGSTIDAVERDKLLPFGKWGYDLLKSVHTARGQYSEIMVVTQNHGVGVGRLVVSPFARLLYSTTGEDVQRIRNLRASGMSLVDAINHLLHGGTRHVTREAA